MSENVRGVIFFNCHNLYLCFSRIAGLIPFSYFFKYFVFLAFQHLLTLLSVSSLTFQAPI